MFDLPIHLDIVLYLFIFSRVLKTADFHCPSLVFLPTLVWMTFKWSGFNQAVLFYGLINYRIFPLE